MVFSFVGASERQTRRFLLTLGGGFRVAPQMDRVSASLLLWS